MAYRDLRDWIRALEEAGELKRIAEPVDIRLDLAAVTDLVSKAGGPALLFEKPVGPTGPGSVPVLINQFGSRRRMEMALGVSDIEEIPRRIKKLLEMEPPESLLDGLKQLPELARLLRVKPRVVSSAPCQEVVKTGDEIRLSEIPVITAWPQDAGPFVSLGCVITRDPENGKRNVGMYRLQVFDERTTGMHWHKHHTGAEHADKVRRGDRMPVAVAIGTDPTVTFSAPAPLPPGIDELMFAGFLRGGPVDVVKCRTVPLEVPATAEYVLEGWVDPSDLRVEGPYGDHTGFYSLADRYPAFHVTAITHRRNPIYATTIVGKPPMEDCWMAQAIERIFLPLLQKVVPEIVDMHLPFEGVFHNLALVSIRKRYPGHARKVMSALWGLGQMAFTKAIVVFDETVNVQDVREAAWAAFANIDPERDIMYTFGPAETLDHASRRLHYSSKIGIDATRKWESEGFDRPWPDIQAHDAATVERARTLLKSCGLTP